LCSCFGHLLIGYAVIVAFLWGVIAFPEDNKIENWPLTILGLFLMMAGIAGISFSNTSYVKNIGVKVHHNLGCSVICKKYSSINSEVDPLVGEESEKQTETNSESAVPQRVKRPIIGFICAIGLGYAVCNCPSDGFQPAQWIDDDPFKICSKGRILVL
jgi:hypothetical protein